MPCYDPYTVRDPDGSYGFTAEQASKHLDKLTRLLCEACHKAEVRNLTGDFSRELATWWSEHKKFDAKRRAKR